MTTNEILFWSLVIVTWGLSLMIAYFQGRSDTWRAATKLVDEAVNRKIREKLDELKKQPPIR